MFQVLILVFALPVAAAPEDDKTRSAREEVEKQLNEMVKVPPAGLELSFDGIDSTRYTLLEGHFTLDDVSLPLNVSAAPRNKVTLFSGNVEPGDHVIAARLVYQEGPTVSVFSYAGGTKFKIPARFTVKAQRGLMIHLHTRVEVDDGAETKKKLQLTGDFKAEMLAKLDDGTLPEPPHKLVSEVKETVVTPATVAVATAPQDTEPEAAASPRHKRGHSQGVVKLASAKPARDRPSPSPSVPQTVAAAGAPVAVPATTPAPVVMASPLTIAGPTATVVAPLAHPPSPGEDNSTLVWIATGAGTLIALALGMSAWGRRRQKKRYQSM